MTINATGTNGNTAGSGITTGPGAGADTINAPLALGGNQTWTLNVSPSSPLTINGPISGAHSLAVSGSGQLVLGGNDTFTGGLTISNNVNVVLSNTGALNGSSPDSVTFGASSTGTLNLNGNSITIGTLSSNGGLPVIRNSSAIAASLTVSQAGNGAFGGSILDGTGGGALGFTKAGNAMLTLSGSEGYTGATTITGGELYITGTLGGTSGVAVNSGVLGGAGGLIAAAVNVASGATISPTAGTGNAPGTLTLGNGLTIQGGGIAAFNIINGGANDQIALTGPGGVLTSQQQRHHPGLAVHHRERHLCARDLYRGRPQPYQRDQAGHRWRRSAKQLQHRNQQRHTRAGCDAHAAGHRDHHHLLARIREAA